MTYKLVGQEPYQIPSNADLGTLAYQNADGINVGLVNIGNTASIVGLVAPLTVGYSQSAAGTLLYLTQVPTSLSTGGVISGSNIAANTTVTSFVAGFSTYQPTYTATTASTLVALTSTYGLSTNFGVGGTGITYGTVVSSISNVGLPVTYNSTGSSISTNTLYIGTTTNVAVNQIVIGSGVVTGTYVTSITANISVTVSNTNTNVSTGTALTFVPTVTLSSAITANTQTQNLLFFPTVTLNQNSSAAVTQGTVVNNYFAPTSAGNAALVIQQGGIGVTGNSYFANAVTITGNLTAANITASTLTGIATTATNVAGGAAGSIPIQVSPGVTGYIPLGTSGYVLTAAAGNTATWQSVSGLSAGTATNAVNIQTQAQSLSGTYYPTFVNANNNVAAYASEYTTSSFSVNPATGSVNASYMNVTNAGTVSQPAFTFGATNRGIYNPSGGDLGFVAGGYLQLYIASVNPAVNYLQVAGGIAGAPVVLTATGTDSIVNLTLATKNNGAVIVSSTSTTNSTNSGALQVVGGVGVGGGGYFGGIVTATNMFSGGGQVITTATLSTYGITTVTAGTDTAVSIASGNATIWDTSTLQSVTGRGASSTNQVILNNGLILGSTANNPILMNGSYSQSTPSFIVANGTLVGTTASTTIYAFNYQHNLAPVSTATINSYYGQLFLPTLTNTATYNSMYGAFARIDMSAAATSGTVATWIGFTSENPNRNAAADVRFTNHYGFRAQDPSAITATNVVGFYSQISAGTNKYNIYASGSAVNYFQGGIGIGTGSVPGSYKLDIGSGGLIRFQSSATITDTTISTSTTTGALNVYGGVGIGGSLFVGGTSTVLSTLASTGSVQSNALYVAGGVGIGTSLYVTGPAVFNNSVTFSGTTTFVLSTNTVYTDNILELHYPNTGTVWTVDDGKDIGLRFHYYNAGDQNAALVLASDSKYLEWYGSGTEDSTSTIKGSYGTFKTGGIILTNTTTSVSTTTGALQVAGGVGVGGSVYVGNRVGFVTTANVSVVYQFYNVAVGSLDTVFG